MKFKHSIICALCVIGHLSAEQTEERVELPSDFLRDVMLPVGVPFVSLFHAARESLFFNTHFSHPHPLEAVGDFFLVPSRYLFAGKRIQIENHEGTWKTRVTQQFSYRRKHWLKTFFSAAALPASYALGSTFKGLSYLFAKVRHKHRDFKQSFIQSHLDSYQQRGLPELYSDEITPCLGHKRPSGLTHKQRIEINALKEIAQILDSHNIPYWIECGTCLGAYRYGGIIPWDWDIDIGILVDDHENVKELLSTLDPKQYQIQDWSSYSKPKTFLKLYVKETKNFIDIYHYQINEENQTVGYVFTYIDSPFPDSWKKAELKCTTPLAYTQLFPLKKTNFDGLTVWAPHDTVGFLQSKYGPNLEPTMVWVEETKSYEKVLDHPYYQ